MRQHAIWASSPVQIVWKRRERIQRKVKKPTGQIEIRQRSFIHKFNILHNLFKVFYHLSHSASTPPALFQDEYSRLFAFFTDEYQILLALSTDE